MQTIEHIMCLLLASNGNMNFVDRQLASFLLPDAIRLYTKHRELSHFEQKADYTDVSYMKYPKDMKTLSQDIVTRALMTDSHLVEHAPCVIGEETSLQVYSETNYHLPTDMYNGILYHLSQDIVFDAFIRKMVDCRDRYNDVFIAPNGDKMDGAKCRKYIATVESHLSWVLARQCKDQLGITVNQEWFDKNIYPILCRDYPQELADNTYKYMKFNPMIDTYISMGDWSGVENNAAGISAENYMRLVDNAVNITRNPFGMNR